MGFLVGVFTAFICKGTRKDCTQLKPMFILAHAVLAYGLALELWSFSPVISLITFGIREGFTKVGSIQFHIPGTGKLYILQE